MQRAEQGWADCALRAETNQGRDRAGVVRRTVVVGLGHHFQNSDLKMGRMWLDKGVGLELSFARPHTHLPQALFLADSQTLDWQ